MKPSSSVLLSIVQTGVMVAIGAGFFLKWNHPHMAITIWSLAVLLLLSALFCPPAHALIQRSGTLLRKWVGIFLTWGLLTPFFYLCFLPLHLVQVLRQQDPLSRRFPTTQSTYWLPRKPTPNLDSYKKQF